MRDVFGARRLEQEIDGMISAALKVGLSGQIAAAVNGRERILRVDNIVCDDSGFPSEIWLSSPAPTSFFRRILNRLLGVRRLDLMRVAHEGGDVRRTVTTVEVAYDGITHIGFREELGAPRISRSVASFIYPRGDAARWMRSYRKAS